MCGIVGILLRDPGLEPRLGALVAPMLAAMGARGPDSAGLGLYRDPVEGRWLLSLRADVSADWQRTAIALRESTGRQVTVVAHSGCSATLALSSDLDDLAPAVREVDAGLHVLGWGRSLEVIKDVGNAGMVCARYDVAERTGYLAVGHTRMATESAVTAQHSHPFVPGPDLCMVHNGSFSNYASIRRRLEAEGIQFETDNDSEVAARHLACQLGEGQSLEEAVRQLMKDLDGFFTLVITTPTELSVVRDAFACKPAVVVETAEYVAVASEYRALATLPGVDQGSVFEPRPEEVYTWTR